MSQTTGSASSEGTPSPSTSQALPPISQPEGSNSNPPDSQASGTAAPSATSETSVPLSTAPQAVLGQYPAFSEADPAVALAAAGGGYNFPTVVSPAYSPYYYNLQPLQSYQQQPVAAIQAESINLNWPFYAPQFPGGHIPTGTDYAFVPRSGVSLAPSTAAATQSEAAPATSSDGKAATPSPKPRQASSPTGRRNVGRPAVVSARGGQPGQAGVGQAGVATNAAATTFQTHLYQPQAGTGAPLHMSHMPYAPMTQHYILQPLQPLQPAHTAANTSHFTSVGTPSKLNKPTKTSIAQQRPVGNNKAAVGVGGAVSAVGLTHSAAALAAGRGVGRKPGAPPGSHSHMSLSKTASASPGTGAKLATPTAPNNQAAVKKENVPNKVVKKEPGGAVSGGTAATPGKRTGGRPRGSVAKKSDRVSTPSVKNEPAEDINTSSDYSNFLLEEDEGLVTAEILAKSQSQADAEKFAAINHIQRPKIAKFMKKVLPKGCIITEDAKAAVQCALTEFMCLVTSEACDSGDFVEGSGKLDAPSILRALTRLGFQDYATVGQRYVEKYQDWIADEAAKRVAAQHERLQKLKKLEDTANNYLKILASPNPAKLDPELAKLIPDIAAGASELAGSLRGAVAALNQNPTPVTVKAIIKEFQSQQTQILVACPQLKTHASLQIPPESKEDAHWEEMDMNSRGHTPSVPRFPVTFPDPPESLIGSEFGVPTGQPSPVKAPQSGSRPGTPVSSEPSVKLEEGAAPTSDAVAVVSSSSSSTSLSSSSSSSSSAASADNAAPPTSSSSESKDHASSSEVLPVPVPGPAPVVPAGTTLSAAALNVLRSALPAGADDDSEFHPDPLVRLGQSIHALVSQDNSNSPSLSASPVSSTPLPGGSRRLSRPVSRLAEGIRRQLTTNSSASSRFGIFRPNQFVPWSHAGTVTPVPIGSYNFATAYSYGAAAAHSNAQSQSQSQSGGSPTASRSGSPTGSALGTPRQAARKPRKAPVRRKTSNADAFERPAIKRTKMNARQKKVADMKQSKLAAAAVEQQTRKRTSSRKKDANTPTRKRLKNEGDDDEPHHDSDVEMDDDDEDEREKAERDSRFDDAHEDDTGSSTAGAGRAADNADKSAEPSGS